MSNAAGVVLSTSDGRVNMGAMPRSLTIQPISGALGAEISGVDLAKDLDDATVAAIRQAWLEHLVIFFRDQDLPPAGFLAFARCFGKPIEYPFVKGLDEAPEMYRTFRDKQDDCIKVVMKPN